MILLIIISLIFDGLLSSFSNIFIPLFTLSSLVIIYKKKKNFIWYSLIIGLLYGIIFTNMFLLELISYYLCSIFIVIYFDKMKYNLMNTFLITIINIILYRTINFLILCFSRIIKFNMFLLFKSIYSSILINLIYIAIMYFVFIKIFNKSNKKKYKLYN